MFSKVNKSLPEHAAFKSILFLAIFYIKKINIFKSTCGASLYSMRILLFNRYY